MFGNSLAHPAGNNAVNLTELEAEGVALALESNSSGAIVCYTESISYATELSLE